jgi:CPA2 family monovalent cation:H+ antiporter-2
MLLDPEFLIRNWALVAMMVAVIAAIKLLVVFGVVRLFGFSARVALLTGAGLFQIGEFGFILAQGGINVGILSERLYSLILASAIITMLLTPISVGLTSRLLPKLLWARGRGVAVREISASPASVPSETHDRVVIAGYGRVGQNVAQGLQDAGIPYLVVDIDPERVSEARTAGRPRMYGDASNIHVLKKVGLDRARALVITYPDPINVVTTAKVALHLNPELKILARVHRVREADILKGLGVDELVSPEYEASFRFIKRLLNISLLDKEERKRILALIRRDEEIAEFNPDQSV